MGLTNGDRDLSLLRALGYSRFKIISQRTFAPPRSALQRVLSRVPPRFWLSLKRVERAAFGRQRDGDWRFAYGSSGTFGADLPGRWLDYDRAIAVWRMLRGVHERVTSRRLGEWYDIHATT